VAQTDGSTSIWLMNGTSVQTYGASVQMATTWNVVDAHSDYNGDGKSDILWRNSDGEHQPVADERDVSSVQTYGCPSGRCRLESCGGRRRGDHPDR
jgi:hypothetical protein